MSVIREQEAVISMRASIAALSFSESRARFPSTTKRTPLSIKVFTSLWMASIISSIRRFTSASGRFQFSSEKA